MRKLLIFLSAVLIVLIGLWGTLVLYFDEARLKQIAIEQVRAQTGRELQINGPLKLDFLPRISLVAEDVTLSGPADFDGPNLFEADSFRMSLALWPLLRGQVETGDIALDNARLVIHTDRSGRSSLDGLAGGAAEPAAETSSPAARPAVSTGSIALSQARLTMSDASTDARQVFIVERLQIDSFAFDRPFGFRFEGGIGEPPMVDDIDVRGTLVVPSGSGPIQVTELGLTAVAAGLPLGLSGAAELDPGPPLVARFSNGELDLNGKSFRTSFSYRDGTRPKVDAELQGESLNIDALLAMMPGSEEAVADPDEPSPLLLLREFDVDARLTLDEMVLSGLTINEVQARLRSDRGLVTIDPLSGRLAGGRIDAVAMADLRTEPPVIQLDPVFDLERIGDALAPWGVQRFVRGAGIVELGLSARGLDIDSILSTLSGTGRYALRDGAIEGIDLDGMVDGLVRRDLAAAVTAGVGGSTAFETLSGALEIRDGSIRLPGMSLATKLLGVSGEVRLGLADLALDGQLQLAGERLQDIPVRLGGTLLKPQLTPDVGEALKQEAGRRVLDLLQKRTERKRDDGEGDGD